MTLSLLRSELPASITPAESAELAARLRALAQSGLSLEGGLRALAEEIGGGRLAGALDRLAARLERGEPLEKAIAAPDCRLPVVLRGLIVAGVHSGRLPDVLDQFAVMVRRRHDLRQRLISTFAYPVILLSIVAVLLSLFPLYVVDEYRKLFAGFGMRLPELTRVYLSYSGVVAWTFLGLAVIALVVPAVALLPLGGWLGRLLARLPVVGPIVRQERYIQFTGLMATLLEAQTPLPEALDLAAIAMRGTLLQGPCRAASTAVHAGMPLDEAMAGAGFLDRLTCLAAWGQQNNALPEAFRSAAESFEARCTSQTGLLNMILLPFVLLAIGGFVAVSVIALFTPLLSLVSNLSSGGGGARQQQDDFVFASALVVSIAAFLLGAGTLTVISWFVGPAPRDNESPFLRVVRTSAWTLAIGGLVLGVLLYVPGLVIVVLAILPVVLSMAYGKHAQTQQYAMLALIGATARRAAPLEPAIIAFGNERGGWMRERAKRMARMLLDGVPLPEAAGKVPGVIPPEAVPLVRVGHDTGALPAAIDQAIAAHNLSEPVWQSIVPKVGYLCLFPSLAVGVVAFIMLRIVPQFEKIFKDFGMRLPEMTRGLIHAANFAEMFWFLLAPLWLAVIALFFYCMLRYAGWVQWDVPGLAWLARRRHTATVLDGISLAAGQQKPLADAVSQLAAGYPQAKIARRLWAASDDMEAGGNDLETLYRHRLLGKTDLALLQAARRNGNLAWAARELADSNRRRMVYRANTLWQTVFPPIVIIYGLAVAMIAAALFLPLIKLISGLAGGYG